MEAGAFFVVCIALRNFLLGGKRIVYWCYKTLVETIYYQ